MDFQSFVTKVYYQLKALDRKILPALHAEQYRTGRKVPQTTDEGRKQVQHHNLMSSGSYNSASEEQQNGFLHNTVFLNCNKKNVLTIFKTRSFFVFLINSRQKWSLLFFYQNKSELCQFLLVVKKDWTTGKYND